MESQRLGAILTMTLMALLAITVGGSSLLVVRSISKPLDKLTKGAGIIGTGDLEHKVEIQSKDELGQLADAFNKMTADLSKDRTERKRAEEELQDSEERFKQFFDNNPGYCYMVSPDGVLLDANKAALMVLGFEKKQLVGRSLQTLYAPESLPKMNQCLEKWKRTGVLKDEELTIIAQNGDRRTVLLSAEGIMDRNGKLLHSVSVQRDITERKQMEEQLRHSQVLASLGEMTAGIAHEVGNPLASIVLYSDVAMKGADNTRQTRKDLRVIHNEAKRAGKLMKDLLAYSRKLEPKLRRLDLHNLVKRVIDMRQYQQNVQNIATATDLRHGPLYVQGDPSQLTQVFLNLILNAEEAIRESNGKHIGVTSRIDGEWATISIADDGIGIPEEYLSQVFHPFFTTKKIGEGTGLGLSTCYGIITAQGGLIRAENNEMGGATFTVQLPLAGNG